MVSGCQLARLGTYYPPALWLVGVSLILAGITDTIQDKFPIFFTVVVLHLQQTLKN